MVHQIMKVCLLLLLLLLCVYLFEYVCCLLADNMPACKFFLQGRD